jgi:hypothetical protein
VQESKKSDSESSSEDEKEKKKVPAAQVEQPKQEVGDLLGFDSASTDTNTASQAAVAPAGGAGSLLDDMFGGSSS